MPFFRKKDIRDILVMQLISTQIIQECDIYEAVT